MWLQYLAEGVGLEQENRSWGGWGERCPTGTHCPQLPLRLLQAPLAPPTTRGHETSKVSKGDQFPGSSQAFTIQNKLLCLAPLLFKFVFSLRGEAEGLAPLLWKRCCWKTSRKLHSSYQSDNFYWYLLLSFILLITLEVIKLASWGKQKRGFC